MGMGLEKFSPHPTQILNHCFPMNIRPITLRGINVYPFPSFEKLLEYINSKNGILIAINAEKILHATKEFKDMVNQNIGYADGIGAVMALKKKKAGSVARIPGCELWLKIINRYQQEKTFYLVGGKQEIIEATVTKLQKEYPGIQILGYRNGYIQSDKEHADLLEDITAKKPDIIFVAMGSPKQEWLMQNMLQRHQAIYQGLGGSFDVYTGKVKRASEWWVKNNLEWAYRLIKQPTRIKRQLHLIRFLWLLETKKI